MKINPYSQVGKGQQPNGGAKSPVDGRGAPEGKDSFLTPGQVLSGRVLRVEQGGRILLAFNRELIFARTLVPLAAGSEHWFEVRRGGPEPWLALAPGKGAALELFRMLAGEEGIRGRAWDLLLQLPGGPQPAWPAAAAALCRNLAAQLAGIASTSQPDPASIILGLLLLQSPGSRMEDRGQFRRGLAELLDILPLEASGRKEIESLARMLSLCDEASRQASQGERFYLLPCLLAGGTGWGEWLFSLESGGKEAAGPGPYYRLSFFLRLSRLGDLHLQVDRRENSICGRINTASDQARRHLEGYLPGLRSGLENLGFRSVQFSCHLADRGLMQEQQEELRRRARLEPIALVDLRA